MRSKKALAVFLSKLKPFETPDPNLEQYPTDSEVAASVLWDAYMQGDVEGLEMADLGCGTGTLGIGALALGAKHVTFIEIDPRVFPILMENLALLEQETKRVYSNYEIIQGNVMEFSRRVHVVLQNPPFGTRQEHADVRFLEKALEMASIVYSLHKTSTLDYLRQWVAQRGARVTAEWPYDFPLKQTMPQHEKRIQRIEVTALRIHR